MIRSLRTLADRLVVCACAFVLLQFLVSAVAAQSARDQLTHLVKQLRDDRFADSLREDILRLAQQIQPPLAIPEEARQHFARGLSLVKQAATPKIAWEAASAFDRAIEVAPWWPDAYRNLAAAQELAGMYDESEKSLRFYVLTNPGEVEARNALNRISALEAKRTTRNPREHELEGFWEVLETRVNRDDSDPKAADGKWKRVRHPTPWRMRLDVRKMGSSYQVALPSNEGDWILETTRADASTLNFKMRLDKTSISYACRLDRGALLCTEESQGYSAESRFAKRAHCERISDSPGITGYPVLCKGEESALQVAGTDGHRSIEPTGIYALESAMDFNVLERVTFDPATGRLTLVGRRDERYSMRPIPYLQYLAVLLEHPRPEFSLRWTPDSRRRVDEFISRSKTPAEAKRLENEWTRFFDTSTGVLTQSARLMFPAMGVSPAWNGREAGHLGAAVVDAPELSVRITSVEPGSPAAQAGLRSGDLIAYADGMDPLTAREFERYVRLQGAGSKLTLDVRRGRDRMRPEVVLAAAHGDPWAHVTQTEGAALLMHAAGNTVGAQVHYLTGLTKRLEANEDAASALLNRMNQALGMTPVWAEYSQKAERGEISRAQGGRFLARTTLERLDSAYRMTNRASVRRFDQLVDARGPSVAMQTAMTELDLERQKSGYGHAFDTLWARPDGIQIPAELVQRAFGVQPDVVPEYVGVDSRSQLARLMFDADYLGKKLMNMPELKQRIPRYQTEFAFTRQRDLHAGRSSARKDASYHMWISIGGIELAAAKDGSTIEVRRTNMRFNIREKGRERASDPPAPDSYEHLLTSLYDDLAREFPDLHELREAAKLAAVAEWIESRRPGFRLPKAGRVSWNGPAKVPGLMYLYMHSPDPGTNFTLTWMPLGGLILSPFPSGSVREIISTDPAVVDLRPAPRPGSVPFLVPRESGRPVTAPQPIAWTTLLEHDGKTFTAATVVVEPGLRDAPATVERGRNDDDALTLWKAGDLEAAIKAYRRIINSPQAEVLDRVAAHLALVQIFDEKGDSASAMRELDAARKLAPNFSGFILANIMYLNRRGDSAAAAAELRRYLALEPGNQAAARALAQIEAGATRTPVGRARFNSAYQQAVSAAASIEANLRGGAHPVFDQGVYAAPGAPALVHVPTPRSAPAALQAKPEWQQLQADRARILAQQRDLQTKLEQVRARSARGEGDRNRLESEERTIMRQQQEAKAEEAAVERRMIDLSVEFAEENAASPQPRTGAAPGARNRP